MKKIKKISIILTFIASVVLFCTMISGCAKKYEFYDSLDVSSDYHNKLYNLYYEDGKPKEGDLVYKDGTYIDKTSPENYTYIINDGEQFKSIIYDYPEEIDFNKKTVIVYIYSCAYASRYVLKDVDINGKNVKIYCARTSTQKPPQLMTSLYARSFMLVLDKVDIESAEFIYEK